MKKILTWSGIVLLILLLILVSVPFLFKGKIIQLVKQEANNSLHAQLDFTDVDVSLIRNFPNLSVRLEQLSIINQEPFRGDTLLSAQSLGVTLDLMSVIQGKTMDIRSVLLDKAVMNFKVTKDGKANWDIAKPSQSAAPGAPTAFKASLKKYELKDARILYDDRSLDFYLLLEQVNHSGSGDFTQDLFTLVTKTSAAAATMKYEGVPYIAHAKTEIDASLEMDMKNMKFTFKENKAVLNELNITVDGWVAMPDTNIDMDIKFATPSTDFKTFLSMIPAVYSKDFSSISASGSMKLDGNITGRYNAVSIPGFGIKLLIENGRFKYPSLPAEVKDVFVKLDIANPDGVPDHTVIDLSRLHANLAGDVVDARLSVKTPSSDPDLDVFLKGRINLSNVSSYYPLEKGTDLTGTLEADAKAKGRLSAMEKQDLEHFDASGSLYLKGVRYTATSLKKPVDVAELSVILDPQVVKLTALKMTVGNTDLQANGSLENALGYMLKGQVIRGNLNLRSNRIDLNEWMAGSTTSDTVTTDSIPMSVFLVPATIDFVLNADIGTLQFQEVVVNEFKGELKVKDQKVSMNGVSMKLMDGSIQLRGSYGTLNPKAPTIDFGMEIKDFDIQKVANTFSSVAKMAPLAKHCTGKFGTIMSLTGTLDEHMSPDLNSLSGSGKLSMNNIIISNFPAFDKMADALKMPSWKKWALPSMNPSFRFMNGRVFIDPVDVEVNGIKTKIAGSNGFDQSIDYVMNVEIPRSALGNSANALIDQLVSKANAKGANVKVGEVIPVTLLMKGTVTDPKITTDLNQQGAKAMDALKDAAKAEFEKQKAAAEEKAREEAARLKAEADARIAAEKAKAQAEVDRRRKEMEARAKQVADSLKKAAENEAKKAIDKFNPFKK